VEEAGVECGGGADGEVGAVPEAPVVSQERRHQRQAQAFGDEVEDEAAVAVAAGGAAEEGGAVGRAGDGVEDGVPVEDDGVVAGVGQGVAEAEDGVVAPDGEGGDAAAGVTGDMQRRREEERDGGGQPQHDHLSCSARCGLSVDY
jgi:hypothetical protein